MSGRNWREEMIVLAKDIRAYMFKHPGCTADEIYAAHPDRKYFGKAFELLTQRRMARFEGNKPAKWFAVQQ